MLGRLANSAALAYRNLEAKTLRQQNAKLQAQVQPAVPFETRS